MENDNNNDVVLENQFIIAEKYILSNQIGKGAFGSVFKGIYMNRDKEQVAIKMEDANSPASLLKHETRILQYLNENHCYKIPKVHWYGIEEDKRILVISYYDSTLLDYYMNSEDKLKTLNSIMYNAIHILYSLHKNFIIHRDIKPQNFMVKNGELYLIDFGLSTFYINEQKEHFLDFGCNDTIIGTPRFVSYYIHEGYTPSRRDDMISLGYIYISLLNGNLKWDYMNFNVDKNETNDKLNLSSSNNIQRKDLKSWISLEPVLKDTNNQIWKYLKHSYSLNFSQKPLYNELCDIFM
jgi:casein kinase 1